MSIEELKDTLPHAKRQDWFAPGVEDMRVFRPDLNIRIERQPEVQSFQADWLAAFGDVKDATLFTVVLWYASTPVLAVDFVTVSPGVELPVPKLTGDGWIISPLQYAVARARDLLGNLDDNLEQGGFRVV